MTHARGLPARPDVPPARPSNSPGMELTRRVALTELAWLAMHSARPALGQQSVEPTREPSREPTRPPRHAAGTRRVLDYLQSQYGTKMLAGHHVGYGESAPREMSYTLETTGRFPAIVEFEAGIYGHRYHPYIEDVRDQIFALAREHWRSGGLVSLCWHWGNPLQRENSYEGTKSPFDIAAAWKPNTPEHRALRKDLEDMARFLSRFRDAGITLLWRPLHEMCGDWFWWSLQGREMAQRLWLHIYGFLTDEHHLNNLIWCYSASQELRLDWMPELATVDIVGVDIYRAGQQSSRKIYDQLTNAADNRPLALTECDLVPELSELQQSQFLWAWFTTWHGEYVRQNRPEKLRALYQHPLVLTRDELPRWTD